MLAVEVDLLVDTVDVDVLVVDVDLLVVTGCVDVLFVEVDLLVVTVDVYALVVGLELLEVLVKGSWVVVFVVAFLRHVRYAVLFFVAFPRVSHNPTFHQLQ